jgi:hypothetical protein
MSNGSEACCAIGVCCPPASAKRSHALAAILEDEVGKELVTCLEAADAFLKHFDPAPKGTSAVFGVVAELVRNHAPSGPG